MTRNGWAWLAFFAAAEAGLMLFVDRPLSEYLRTVDAVRPALIDFFRAYTDAGKSKWYLWPAAAGTLFCALWVRMPSLTITGRKVYAKWGRHCLFLFAGVGLAGIASDIIKPLVGRARPVVLLREHIYGFHPLSFNAQWNSWPSGHADTAFALMAVLTLIAPRGFWLWLAFALAIQVSRVMVNAHYLSDTIAGAALGVTIVLLVQRGFNHNRIIPLLRWIFPIDLRPRRT